MTQSDLEQRLRQLAWPTASADLRARIVRCAPPHERRIAWVDRLWFSRAWRLSMAFAIVLVPIVGQWAAARPQPLASPAATLAQTQALEDLAQQFGIPADEAAGLVRHTNARRTASSASNAIRDLFPVEGVPQ